MASGMTIHRLYVDDKGESHFATVDVEFTESGRAGRMTARLPATGIIFREVPPDYDLDWHPAPRRQYIINLDAGVELTASDGETRRIGAGEIVLVEDTWGKGHRSRAVDRTPRHCIFVPVD
jgi:quercetin dioxygenase-like cupin family protein